MALPTLSSPLLSSLLLRRIWEIRFYTSLLSQINRASVWSLFLSRVLKSQNDGKLLYIIFLSKSEFKSALVV
jgi:hypothetical protein